MLSIGPIYGIAFGLEYLDDEDLGFIINVDLGIIRFTWYKDFNADSLQ